MKSNGWMGRAGARRSGRLRRIHPRDRRRRRQRKRGSNRVSSPRDAGPSEFLIKRTHAGLVRQKIFNERVGFKGPGALLGGERGLVEATAGHAGFLTVVPPPRRSSRRVEVSVKVLETRTKTRPPVRRRRCPSYVSSLWTDGAPPSSSSSLLLWQ